MGLGISVDRLPPFANPEGVETAAAGIVAQALSVANAQLTTTFIWERLGTSYDAPETDVLVNALTPTTAVSRTVVQQAQAISRALLDYAATERDLIARRETLRADISSFEQSIAGQDNWTTDQAKANRHNELGSRLDELQVAHEEAERACASAISALVGGPKYVQSANDGSEATVGTVAHGHSREMYEEAAKAGKIPWSSRVEWDKPWYQDIGDGIGEGAVAVGTFLFNAVNVLDQEKFQATWGGIGQTATALSSDITTVMNVKNLADHPQEYARAVLRLDQFKNDLFNVEEWKSNPFKAFGRLLGEAAAGSLVGGPWTSTGVRALTVTSKVANTTSRGAARAAGIARDAGWSSAIAGRTLIKAGDLSSMLMARVEMGVSRVNFKFADAKLNIDTWVAHRAMDVLDTKVGSAIGAKVIPQAQKAAATLHRFHDVKRAHVARLKEAAVHQAERAARAVAPKTATVAKPFPPSPSAPAANAHTASPPPPRPLVSHEPLLPPPSGQHPRVGRTVTTVTIESRVTPSLPKPDLVIGGHPRVAAVDAAMGATPSRGGAGTLVAETPTRAPASAPNPTQTDGTVTQPALDGAGRSRTAAPEPSASPRESSGGGSRNNTPAPPGPTSESLGAANDPIGAPRITLSVPRSYQALYTLETFKRAHPTLSGKELELKYQESLGHAYKALVEFDAKVDFLASEALKRGDREGLRGVAPDNRAERSTTRRKIINNPSRLQEVRLPAGREDEFSSLTEKSRREIRRLLGRHDLDHRLDIQYGGSDAIVNQQWFDRSMNRSLGAQGRFQLQQLRNNPLLKDSSYRTGEGDIRIFGVDKRGIEAVWEEKHGHVPGTPHTLTSAR